MQLAADAERTHGGGGEVIDLQKTARERRRAVVPVVGSHPHDAAVRRVAVQLHAHVSAERGDVSCYVIAGRNQHVGGRRRNLRAACERLAVHVKELVARQTILDAVLSVALAGPEIHHDLSVLVDLH